MKNVKISTAWVVLVYGILLILLALWAYIKTSSTISLVTGGGFGLVLIVCSLLMFNNIRLGKYISLYLTVLLTATFSIRYSMTQKDIPAILSVLSAAVLLFLIARSVDWKK